MKEKCFCEECAKEIRKIASELTLEQLLAADEMGVTPEEYAENL